MGYERTKTKQPHGLVTVTALAMSMVPLAFATRASGQGSSPRPYNGVECFRARQLIASGRAVEAEPHIRACRAKGGVIATPVSRAQAPAAPPSPAPAAPPAPPRAASAPPAGPSTPTALADDTSWASNLPSIDAVRLSIPDPIQQLGALQLLASYTEFRLAQPNVRAWQVTDAQNHLLEYRRLGQGATLIVGGQQADAVAALVGNSAFRRRTLTMLLAGVPIDAFERYLLSKAQVAVGARTQTVSSIDESAAAAKRANVDLTVFGIELNKPLSLPYCSGEGPAQETCRAGGVGQQFFQSYMITGSIQAAPGTTNVPVRLAASRCPDWVSCAQPLIVGMRDGYALSVMFLTSSADSADRIESQITKKYRVAPKTGASYSECRVSLNGTDLGSSKRAPNRDWALPGLTIHYTPFGSSSNCTQGAVAVATTAYGAVVRQATQQHEDSQPKM